MRHIGKHPGRFQHKHVPLLSDFPCLHIQTTDCRPSRTGSFVVGPILEPRSDVSLVHTPRWTKWEFTHGICITKHLGSYIIQIKKQITKCIPHIDNQIQHIHGINVGEGKVEV